MVGYLGQGPSCLAPQIVAINLVVALTAFLFGIKFNPAIRGGYRSRSSRASRYQSCFRHPAVVSTKMRASLVLSFWAASAAALWPIPKTFTSGDKALWIDRDVKINYRIAESVGELHFAQNVLTKADQEHESSYGNPSGNMSWSSQIVENAKERTIDTLYAIPDIFAVPREQLLIMKPGSIKTSSHGNSTHAFPTSNPSWVTTQRILSRLHSNKTPPIQQESQSLPLAV